MRFCFKDKKVPTKIESKPVINNKNSTLLKKVFSINIHLIKRFNKIGFANIEKIIVEHNGAPS